MRYLVAGVSVQSRTRSLALEHPHRFCGVEDLTVEVGNVNGVRVHNAYGAYTCSNKILQGGTSESTSTNYKHTAGLETQLAVEPKLRHNELAAVSRVGELPGARGDKHNHLENGPLDGTVIDGLGHVSESGLSFSKKTLFSADLLQLLDELVRFLGEEVDVACSLGVDEWLGITDDQVEEDSVSCSLGPVGVSRGQTEFVLTGVVGGEGELASWGVLLRNNTVVVIERLVHSDFYFQVVGRHIVLLLRVPFVRLVFAHGNGIFWQFFVETFCFVRVNVEMQRLGHVGGN
ncbi:hypothetical protein OGAPHI_000497 [Ogataea philodendri]|uniref:Uncharacterized protein n=1 Tax=Ogataea philodendri TaxID=1378263 RepID=A0A9P8PH30_9ASCO|nr:uncharacterized protein OGAPHI_000497 [Ogataea philodendri]KAH3671274.1 hypothetical protein OGAPHI_000497 [Ogataea philodendri]